MMLTSLKSLPFAALAAALSLVSGVASAQNYVQTNLVSDLSTVGAVTVDPQLKNAWGITRSATSPWWVNSAGTGTSRLYTGAGEIVAALPQVIVPAQAGSTAASEPTGVLFNGSTDFDLVSGNAATSAIFLFATKQGTISGWNPGVNPTTAVNKVDESANGAVFTGLTWIVVDGEHFLLAPNFHSGAVEAFDKNFNRVLDFTISAVPGFAPYNVQAVGPNVVVTFGEQNAAKNATVNEPGLGFVVVFDVHGNIVSELENGSWFDAPWGVALAPQDFGTFSHDLLIANRGSGTISAFNPVNGRFVGTMVDANNDPITISGLWGIEVGNNSTAGSSTTLYFAAGINGYADGLFGTLTPVASELDVEDHL